MGMSLHSMPAAAFLYPQVFPATSIMLTVKLHASHFHGGHMQVPTHTALTLQSLSVTSPHIHGGHNPAGKCLSTSPPNHRSPADSATPASELQITHFHGGHDPAGNFLTMLHLPLLPQFCRQMPFHAVLATATLCHTPTQGTHANNTMPAVEPLHPCLHGGHGPAGKCPPMLLSATNPTQKSPADNAVLAVEPCPPCY